MTTENIALYLGASVVLIALLILAVIYLKSLYAKNDVFKESRSLKIGHTVNPPRMEFNEWLDQYNHPLIKYFDDKN